MTTTETTTPAHEKAVKVHTRRAVSVLAEAQNELHVIGPARARGKYPLSWPAASLTMES